MQHPSERSPRRIADFAIIGLILVFAAVVSPIGIRTVTGRLDLSPRMMALSLVFAVFLLLVAAAAASRGRMRIMVFYSVMLSFPVVLLAVMEAAAIGLHLADWIAPLEDMSTLANRDGWPAHFMSAGRKVQKDGLLVYQPWESDGISINELGLRTPLPRQKQISEWRIAITGGSVAFGWRVRDSDTIPFQVQQLLRKRGLSDVTVYNFGIDSASLRDELALLKRFQKTYEIDQVIFLTGANDVTFTFMSIANPSDALGSLIAGVNAFELLKVIGRLKASASSELLERLDNELLPKIGEHNSLLDGLIAADRYCRESALRCDFALQPVLLMRKTLIEPEVRVAQTLRQLYPRYDQLFTTMYRIALNSGLPVHDTSNVFDGSIAPYFIDVAHLNEAGNHRLAERVSEIAAARMPTALHVSRPQ